MSRIRIIGRNLKFSSVEKVLALVLNLVLLPFIVSHVGKELYGAYMLVLAFSGYVGLLDFGVVSAVVKYVAEFLGQKDEKKLASAVNTSITFYVLVSAVIGILLWIFSFYFDRFFEIEAQNREIVRQLFWVAAIASLVVWPGKTFSGVLRGLQRYDWLATIGIIQKAGTAIAAYVVFTSGQGILSFVIWSYVFMIFGNVAAYAAMRYSLSGCSIRLFRFSPKMFRKMIGFSFFIFLGGLTNIAILHIDEVVVGSFVSVSAVTLYSVAYMLQNGFRSVNAFVGDPLFPLCAGMEGKKEFDKQRELFFKGTRYITYSFIPMLIIVIVFARPAIGFWMGQGFDESVLVARVLLAFWFANSTIEVGAGMLTAKGYARQLLKINVFNAITNLILSLVLVQYMGLVGVAIGTTIPMFLINFPLTLSLTLKILNVSFGEFYRKTIRDNIPIYAVTLLLSLIVMTQFYPTNLVTTLLEMAAIYVFVLLGGLLYSFSPKERQELLVLVRG